MGGKLKFFKVAHAWILINITAYIALITVGESMQKSYVRPKMSRGVDSALLEGHEAPQKLLAILPRRPAVILVFPSCAECSVDSPTVLKGQAFDRHIFVALPGVPLNELDRYKDFGANISFLSSPESLSASLGVEAAPRFFSVDVAGIITYVQPSYVGGNLLYKVANGIRR